MTRKFTSSLIAKLFLLTSLMMAIPVDVLAQCSRPIVVPVASAGFTGAIKDGKIFGIVPTLLTEASLHLGCQFVLSYVPKNRQEHLFEEGQSDVMLISNRTDKLDEAGLFVPMLQIRPTFISLRKNRAPVGSIKNLLNDSSYKVVVVRGHNYGDEYTELLRKLQDQDRVIFESDTQSVIKMMQKNPKWISIMGPIIFIGTIKTEPTLSDFSEKIRYESVEEFPWTDSGLYISKKSLSTQDQQYLFTHLNSIMYKEKLWNSFKQYFESDEILLGLRKKR